MENLYTRIVDACIEMNAGEIVCLDDDVFGELKRRKLVRKKREDDSAYDESSYVISGYGKKLADRVFKTRGE